MHILDDESDKKLNNISLFLTNNEALHLIGYLEQLLEGKSGDHSHLMSENYKKEITVCLYNSENTKNFHPRIQKLITNDE
jgi:hypothetical protein